MLPLLLYSYEQKGDPVTDRFMGGVMFPKNPIDDNVHWYLLRKSTVSTTTAIITSSAALRMV